jgi:hypothetical protein
MHLHLIAHPCLHMSVRVRFVCLCWQGGVGAPYDDDMYKHAADVGSVYHCTVAIGNIAITELSLPKVPVRTVRTLRCLSAHQTPDRCLASASGRLCDPEQRPKTCAGAGVRTLRSRLTLWAAPDPRGLDTYSVIAQVPKMLEYSILRYCAQGFTYFWRASPTLGPLGLETKSFAWALRAVDLESTS